MNYMKEFCKQILALGYRHDIWQVWNDFLLMAATSLSNAFPSASRDAREQEYLHTISKYSKEEQQIFPELLAIVTAAFEENPEQDFLGNAYAALNLNKKQSGQFFTPYHICELMSELNFHENNLSEIKEKGYITMSDPACGAGAMLVAFANVAKKHNINYQQEVLFFAQDIDKTAALMCYIQLSLLGCSAFVIVGDSLVKPGFHPDNDVWVTPMLNIHQYRFQEYFQSGKATEEPDYEK